MAATANVTIDGDTRDVINDEPVPGAQVVVQLCGYGSQAPRIINGFVFANLTTTTAVADAEGQYHFTLYSNDLITPEGTYYTFTFLNANGDIQQVNAYYFGEGGEWDTSVLIPYDPNQPPPPLPPLITNLLLTITPVTDTIVFPGDTYTAFKVTLPGDVLNPTIEGMVPGNLYTFIIVQDGTGYHQFLWPGNVYNATTVDPAPNSTTVQTFVADDLGELLAIGPGTYYP